MASACALTVASSIFLLKWFQLFQPIGGVEASFTVCWERTADRSSPGRATTAKALLEKVVMSFSSTSVDLAPEPQVYNENHNRGLRFTRSTPGISTTPAYTPLIDPRDRRRPD